MHQNSEVALTGGAGIVVVMGPNFGKFFDLATFSQAVDKVIAAENLKAIAAKASDPEVVLGLACLARAGSPVRRELSEMAARGKPEYWPVVAVLALTMDGVDENAVGEVINRDPDNALGYYVQANLLYGCDKDGQALEAFRKGAHCSELRLYESITGEAVFKALDTLNIQGRDRLCALTWMACRSSIFSTNVMQFLSSPLSDWARRADSVARQELSELLLVLAGHLFATNFCNRWVARQALEHAIFGLNAQVPTRENFPTMVGAAGATQALISTMLRWPGMNVGEEPDQPHRRLRLAQYLPDRIHRAFAAVDPRQVENLGEFNLRLSDNRKAAFEKARENFVNTGRALIDAALTDADAIMGPYLKGIPLSARGADGRQIVPFETGIEQLLRARPDVFAAAAANEQAMNAMWDFGAGDPSQRNISRMMEINRAIISYAAAHDDTYPDSIDVLFEKGYLKPATKVTSVLTGKPYVYIAAGEKVPQKSKDRWKFVVLYDDYADRGFYHCVFASWVGSAIRAEDLNEQLRKRRKIQHDSAANS